MAGEVLNTLFLSVSHSQQLNPKKVFSQNPLTVKKWLSQTMNIDPDFFTT